MTATPGASDGAAVTGTVVQRQQKPPANVEELRADIAQTRAELGETVQALAARADVKARLHESADEAKARVREKLHDAAIEARLAASEAPQRAQQLAVRAGRAVRNNPMPLAVAAAAVGLLVLFAGWRRRR